jgi:hypothetical protein
MDAAPPRLPVGPDDGIEARRRFRVIPHMTTPIASSRSADAAREFFTTHGRDGWCGQDESRSLGLRHGLSHPGMNGGLYGGRYPWLEQRADGRRYLTTHALRRLRV